MKVIAWPNGPATRRQRNLIGKLAEETGQPVLEGLTAGEASDYIDKLIALRRKGNT